MQRDADLELARQQRDVEPGNNLVCSRLEREWGSVTVDVLNGHHAEPSAPEMPSSTTASSTASNTSNCIRTPNRSPIAS